MVAALDQVCQLSLDPPDSTLSLVDYDGLGRAGRPRIVIDSRFLSFALGVRGPTEIAKVFGCSSRTVRRRALEHGLLRPGEAPFQNVVGDDGNVTRIRCGAPKHTRHSDISDDELDIIVSTILTDFPNFGRIMIDGRLRSFGIIVPRRRIQDAYIRVHGPPPSFIRRRIVRRQYFVAGVNSIWHHDGQHGAYIFTRYRTQGNLF